MSQIDAWSFNTPSLRRKYRSCDAFQVQGTWTARQQKPSRGRVDFPRFRNPALRPPSSGFFELRFCSGFQYIVPLREQDTNLYINVDRNNPANSAKNDAKRKRTEKANILACRG
jgi:hypothetical protein